MCWPRETRDRHHVDGGKSDPGDAKVLADLVRTDRHDHRSIAGNSEEVTLGGASPTRNVPSPTSLRRYLERFHDAAEEERREPHRAFIPAPGAALRGLGRVNADLLAFAQRHHRQRQATLV